MYNLLIWLNQLDAFKVPKNSSTVSQTHITFAWPYISKKSMWRERCRSQPLCSFWHNTFTRSNLDTKDLQTRCIAGMYVLSRLHCTCVFLSDPIHADCSVTNIKSWNGCIFRWHCYLIRQRTFRQFWLNIHVCLFVYHHGCHISKVKIHHKVG